MVAPTNYHALDRLSNSMENTWGTLTPIKLTNIHQVSKANIHVEYLNMQLTGPRNQLDCRVYGFKLLFINANIGMDIQSFSHGQS